MMTFFAFPRSLVTIKTSSAMRKQKTTWLKRLGNEKLSLLFFVLLSISMLNESKAQLAECKDKFLGNIMPSSWAGEVVRSDFSQYWNQVTAENAGKWGVAETSRDNYSWGDLDIMYQYCLDNGFPFKHHVFVWGSQQPDWIGALSPEEQREEVEEWYSIFAQRYPETDIIDVVNESIRNHAPEVEFKDALGGFNNGASIPYLQQNADKYGPYGTGWDYIIYSFAKAREYFPNAELLLNDYGIINDPTAITEHLEIVNILKDRGLIDGVGIQCHQFNVDNMTGAQVTNNLNQLSSAGLPIHVTELDITGNTEQQQRDRYADLFPAFWEHPNVEAVTLWGYVEGTTWIDNTGILNPDGSERAAMVWLKEYMASQPDVCSPEGSPDVEITAPSKNATFDIGDNITIEASATDDDGSVANIEFFVDGVSVGSDNSAPYTFEWTDVAAGSYRLTAVATDNEGNEATSTAVNIAVLGNIVIYANGTDGTEIVELIVDGSVLTTWNINSGWGYYTYDGPSTGVFQINYTNDAEGRDLQLDYLEVDGVKHEAEDQQVNTGSYANDACGGGEYTEYMYCSGYVEFDLTDPTVDSDNDGTPDVSDECPNDPNKITEGECGCGVAEGDCDLSGAYETNIQWTIPGGDQGLAACKAKFVGNIIPSNWTVNPIIQPSWGEYWNQISAENAGKWEVVEGTQDQYNWNDLDVMYDYCIQNDVPFKHHVFIWGSQQPEWLSELPASEQLEEVEEWYSLFQERYPETAIIDVVNESLPGHAPDVAARDAMGGFNNGASVDYLANHPYLAQFGYGTGWDYIIYAFAKARDYFPDAILVLNDYNIINSTSNINAHLEIVNILKERNLIDAVGIQSHAFSVDNLGATTLQNNLDQLATAGLPIHVTELDIRGDDGNEQQQRDRYARTFPIFYEHPAVACVTIWGYIEGQNWFDYTGLLNADGSERAAMTWLKEYMEDQPDVCNVIPNDDNIVVRARGELGGEELELIVNGEVLTTWILSTTNANYTFEGPSEGIFRLNYVNDDTDMDAIIDYLEVDDTRMQAEDQEVNTGYYANGECGGGGFSETMHCNGYIEFNVGCSADVDQDGICDNVDEDLDNDGVATSDDCDDTDDTIGEATVWYEDTDGDGLGDASSSMTACEQPEGYVTASGDECPADGDKTVPGDCGCGVTEDSCLDCEGVANGNAIEDVCGTCTGGTTGLVPVTDPDACITGSSETLDMDAMSIYPNPTSGVVNITQSTTWELYSAHGQLIKEGNTDAVDLSNQASGIYILKAEGKIFKVIKE